MNTPLPANPPKSHQKLSSSPTLEGLKKHIAKYYAGEEKELRPAEPGRWTIHSTTTGRQLSTLAIQTRRGFYFLHP